MAEQDVDERIGRNLGPCLKLLCNDPAHSDWACVMETWTVILCVTGLPDRFLQVQDTGKELGKVTGFRIETRPFLERLHTRATKKNFERMVA